ncbi:MAG TPA: HDIG domain-containing protein [Bacteroidia bacterium]|nr:HDIG domain-containing protein [Bacteroidia bacterium]
MNRFFSFIRDRHSLLYKAFLFLSSLALIVYLYPKGFRFRYDPESLKNRPWPYESLIAPFDFAIQKSPDELASERKELTEKFVPYFRKDENAEKQLLEKFSAEFGSRPAILSAVKDVLSGGIRAITNGAGKGPEDEVLVVTGKVEEEHYLGEYADPVSADSLVRKKLNAADAKLWDTKQTAFSATVVYDSSLTKQSLQQVLDNISPTRGAISKGQDIIDRGEIVDEANYQELESFRQEFLSLHAGGSNWALLFGQTGLAAFCLFILFQFLRLFRREILGNDPKLLFILLMIVLTVCMSYIPSVVENVPVLALPFCILPVIMRAFFDTRIALFVHLITTVIITISLPADRYSFLVIQLLAGITAIFSIVNMRTRAQLFYSVIAILCVYVMLHLAITAIQEGEMQSIRMNELVNYAVSALLVLLAYPLIFFFEKLFGFVSDVTLLELGDTNSPLLRELAERAPGTFQHSIQVANLAEEAIRRVGGNSLLVRTGAMYHDIGKGDMPMYFIENQATGVNPHDELTFEESAAIIISHVIKGIEKAKAAKLPDIVIDFIRTHHGTTNTSYFLSLYKRNNPEEFIDEELFRYPGPIPYSKETAVLMMADSVEASSRSLKKYDGESIDGLVDRIIDHQADQHQFDNSDITMKDISAIKKIFKKKLRSIYHVRVEYPK